MTGLPSFSKKKNAENKWSLHKEGILGRQITDALKVIMIFLYIILVFFFFFFFKYRVFRFVIEDFGLCRRSLRISLGYWRMRLGNLSIRVILKGRNRRLIIC